MRPIAALPFYNHRGLVCEEAREMLKAAGFEIVCNDTGRRLSFEEQHEMIKDAFGIVAGSEKYDAKMLEGCDKLKVVIRFGVGLDNFDLDCFREKGIKVGVIANHNAVAEYTLALMLAALKDLCYQDSVIKAGGWERRPIRELGAMTVGLVGFGRIGRRTAELLKGFGCPILVCDPYADPKTAEAYGVKLVSFEQLMKESDIVSLHLPGTPENRHLINGESLKLMKPGAFLINAARGMLADEDALAKALESKALSFAALDVFEHEPLPEDSPLRKLENTVLSPHDAALTRETNYNAGLTCARSIISVFNGGEPEYPVDLKR